MLKEAMDILDKMDNFYQIDTIRGITRLKHYLNSFKEFEKLLYGSDKWYRDTIYHQLWFYFVGEYFFLNSGIMRDLIKKKKGWYCDPPKEVIIEENVNPKEKARYAFFCVIALCHDLGKPLQKFNSINDAIRKMIKEYQFLLFNPFKVEFSLTYAQMLEYLVKSLSQIIKPVNPLEYIKKNDFYYVKIEDYNEDHPYMQSGFSTALSELDHGGA